MVDYILWLYNVIKKYWIQNIDRAKLRIKVKDIEIQKTKT